jgi:plastocyanin
MRDIDPRWQSTEPTVIGASPKVQTPAKRSASRRPAALVGILLVASLGIAIYGRLSPFQGDVQSVQGGESSSATKSGIEVHITPGGLEPRHVVAQPGQTIVWINETDLPHIFESKDIKDETDQTLYSPAIFPGSRQSFTISKSQTPGTFTYASVTASDVSGEIEIASAGGPGTLGFPSSSASSGQSALGDGNVFPAVKSSSSATNIASTDGADSSASSAKKTPPPQSTDPLLAGFTLSVQQPEDVYTPPPEDNGLIPTNPYAIGSTRTGPVGLANSSVPKTTPKTNLHPGAGTPLVKPKAQPSSGSNTWIVALVITTVLLTGYILMPRKKIS